MQPMHAAFLIALLVPAGVIAEDRPTASVPQGHSRRIPWNDSRVVGSPDPLLPYKTERVFPGLTIKQPLVLLPEPGTNRLLILHHLGTWAGPTLLLAVRDHQDAANAELETLIELDGLAVGVALHPDYEHNGYIYFGINEPIRKRPKKTKVLRYTVSPERKGRIDPASRKVIIEWPSDGHDGGDLAFDNAGKLFVSSGDGSSGSDAYLTGQKIDDLQGSVLRIDVDHPDPGRNYSVPPDNPFVKRPGARPEVWAYGLRNPWRVSFDRASGQLWVGNNGQDLWEQAYLIRKGGNYGWSITEGSHIFQAQRQAGPDPILPPAAEHSHSEARSLSGGQVYRGSRLPELVGAYLYGDWSTGRVWGIRHDGDKVLWHRELVDTPFNITGFGTDHTGELYIIDHAGGFYRLLPTTPADKPARPFPTRLSETGLFAETASHRVHHAILPFDVVAPQWADGASMERFAALPGLERIEQKPQLNAGGVWSLPNGSVLMQTLSLDTVNDSGEKAHKRIETRLLVRQQGEWNGFSYRWNDEQTDAQLVPAAGAAAILDVPDAAAPGQSREQSWRFPSRTECLVCHSRAAGFILAFTPLQLNRSGVVAGRRGNQLHELENLGLFQGALPKIEPGQTRFVDPRSAAEPVEARVRSYLQVNCAPCHVSEGGGNTRMEMGVETPLARANLINEEPAHDRFGLADPRIVAPGAPERSVLVHRLSCRGTGQMPPLVSTEVDRNAVELITGWIRALPPAPSREGGKTN